MKFFDVQVSFLCLLSVVHSHTVTCTSLCKTSLWIEALLALCNTVINTTHYRLLTFSFCSSSLFHVIASICLFSYSFHNCPIFSYFDFLLTHCTESPYSLFVFSVFHLQFSCLYFAVLFLSLV